MKRLVNKAADWLKQKPVRKREEELQSVLWAFVDKLVGEARDERMQFERQWLLNLAFLNGRQYSFFNTSAHMIQEIKRLPGRKRTVDNLLLPKWKRQVADYVSTTPDISVVPATNDDEDIKAAKLGHKVIRHLQRELGEKSLRRKIAAWIYSCGNAFVVDMWDRGRGPTTVDPKTGRLHYAGDVWLEFYNPFEALVPFTGMGSETLNEYPWFGTERWYPIEALRAMPGLEKAEPESLDRYVDTSALFGASAGSTVRKQKGARLVQLFVKPCESFPRGAFIQACNGLVVPPEEFPFQEFPVAHFKDVEVPGLLWGKATLEEAIGSQVRWNRNLNALDEYNDQVAKGKILVPRGAKLEVEMTNQSGQIITYKPVMGHKPESFSAHGLPPTFDKTQMFVQTSIENLFSQHEVRRGTNKSDIRSGDMVALLREQDVAGGQMAYQLYAEASEKMWSRLLRRVQKGYADDRLIKIYGNEGEYEVMSFKGSDLRSNTDVTIAPDSVVPDSRAIRNQQTMDKFSGGLYGDPQDPDVRRKVMHYIDDAIVDDLYDSARKDESVARFENRLLRQGRDVEVNSYDNHQVHLKEHSDDLKGLEIQRLKAENQEQYLQLYVNFLKHMTPHQQFAEEAMAQMAALQNGGVR